MLDESILKKGAISQIFIQYILNSDIEYLKLKKLVFFLFSHL